MKIYFDIVMIATIYVFGLDISGFWREVSCRIRRWATKGAVQTPFGLKPFSCSLCMTFWTGIIYLLIMHAVTIGNVCFVCVVAMLTPRIKDVLLVVDGLLARLFDKLNNLL